MGSLKNCILFARLFSFVFFFVFVYQYYLFIYLFVILSISCLIMVIPRIPIPVPVPDSGIRAFPTYLRYLQVKTGSLYHVVLRV